MRHLYTLFVCLLLAGTLQPLEAAVWPEGYVQPDGTSTLSIYPNPVKNEATLSFSPDVQRIAILNIVGREVLAFTVEPGATSMSIDVSQLQPGVYFMAAQSQGKNLVTKRFMKDL